MSLFDSASLVVTPNGYKEDKLYSIKPTDGSGDLVATRATTATRVNSDGLIEQVPYNLLTYSEQFDNASWTKSSSTITANTSIAPTGNTTADTLTITSGGYLLKQVIGYSAVSGQSITISIFAKNQTTDFLIFGGATAAGIDVYTIQDYGNGWYRHIRTRTFTTTVTTTIQFAINQIGTHIIWGAQLVTGTSAKEYFPTTDTLDIPRLDYTNSTCPSILVEPQRTNLFSYSEQFDNAYWSKTNMVIVANDTTAPDGTNTADRATASLYPSTSITKTNLLTATNHTLSVYVKAGSVSTFRLDLVTGGFAAGSNCIFNLTTLATTITNYGSTTGSTATITSVGNGWYRCTLTVLTTATTYFAQLLPAANGSVYLWGAQLEAGSYATSYIPTVASSVTRNADVISKTGISSLIGQTEGTIFLDVNLNSRAQFTYFALAGSLASSQNYLGIFFGSSAIGFESVVSTILQAGINFSNTSTGRFKIAVGYKANDFVLYINGNLIGTDTSGSVPSCNDLSLAIYGTAATINYNTATLWKTRLSNTELATLTTI